MKTMLVAIAGALSTFAIPLLAQNATSIKNIDEKGRIPYTASAKCTAAPDMSGCSAAFPNVPSGKRLVIEYVNVDILAPNMPAVALNSSGGPTFTVPAFGPRFGNDYGVSAQVLMYINAGQHASVAMLGTRVISAFISGYLVDLTK
jgi:hypothetical protein